MNTFASGNARLSRQDLIRNARDVSGYRLHTASDPRLTQTSQPKAKGMIEGWMLTEPVQPGLAFHVINGHALQDFSIEAQIKPCVKMTLILEGETHLSFGDKPHRLSATACTAHLIKLAEPERCHLQSIAGVHREALNITLEPEWFDWAKVAVASDHALLSEHLSNVSIHVPEHLWHYARYLVHQQELGRAGQLAREGFVLSLVSHWLTHQDVRVVHQGESPESRRAQQFLELMKSDEVLGWSLTQVGSYLGMSHATLQRYAQEYLGLSLTQYLRAQRLRRACIGLKRDGLSIFDASIVAGYSHPSNFTAAFKRCFGVCPTDVHRFALDALLARSA